MEFLWAVVAIGVCLAAAFAFRLALSWNHRPRAVAWLLATTMTGLSPCLVPLSAPLCRFSVTLVAIAVIAKLYDFYQQPVLARAMSLPAYGVCIVNWFWLVLRKPPPRVPANEDYKLLLSRFPAAVVGVAASAVLLSFDYSGIPFALEHSLKVVALVLTVIAVANCAASVWRLCGGSAWDPMRNPPAATTPADYWRRWNRPAQHFFEEYAFLPAGGRRHSWRGIMATFAVSGLVHEYVFGIATGRVYGWQLLFFVLQGIATAATFRARPIGWRRFPWMVCTLILNLILALLFFKSVAVVVPFYSPRG